MSQDASLILVPPIYVAAGDGTLFCGVPYVVGMSATESRWKLVDATGVEYLGPPYVRDQTLDDVQRGIAEWWESQPQTK